MAKRKITVTVDEDLLARLRAVTNVPLSRSVNAALGRHVDDVERHVGLGLLLDEWSASSAPLTVEERAWARQAFDEADSVGAAADSDAA